jgi:pimeloyl-ACP methyl ester carboxylesterase
MNLRSRAAVLKVQTDGEAAYPLELRKLTLSDGAVMSYREIGQGPPVLLIHGWGASGLFFEDLARRLAAQFHVFVPDLRGHGVSTTGSGDASIEQLADDVRQLIRDRSIENATALGWSMGAHVLWRMIAMGDAAPLSGLIVEDMSPRIVNDADWALGMASGLDADASLRAVTAMREDWPAYARGFASKMYARQSALNDPGLVAETVARLAETNPDAMAQLWTSMAQQDLRSALPRMNLPVLVTYGERSQAYSAETSEYLVSVLPDARLQGFAHSGHSPHLEEPDAFAEAVSQFVHRVNGDVSTQYSTEGRV